MFLQNNLVFLYVPLYDMKENCEGLLYLFMAALEHFFFLVVYLHCVISFFLLYNQTHHSVAIKINFHTKKSANILTKMHKSTKMQELVTNGSLFIKSHPSRANQLSGSLKQPICFVMQQTSLSLNTVHDIAVLLKSKAVQQNSNSSA